jgi:hypothetical protein
MKKLLVETADRAARYIAGIANRGVVPLPADVARLETWEGRSLNCHQIPQRS